MENDLRERLLKAFPTEPVPLRVCDPVSPGMSTDFYEVERAERIFAGKSWPEVEFPPEFGEQVGSVLAEVNGESRCYYIPSLLRQSFTDPDYIDVVASMINWEGRAFSLKKSVSLSSAEIPPPPWKLWTAEQARLVVDILNWHVRQVSRLNYRLHGRPLERARDRVMRILDESLPGRLLGNDLPTEASGSGQDF